VDELIPKLSERMQCVGILSRELCHAYLRWMSGSLAPCCEAACRWMIGLTVFVSWSKMLSKSRVQSASKPVVTQKCCVVESCSVGGKRHRKMIPLLFCEKCLRQKTYEVEIVLNDRIRWPAGASFAVERFGEIYGAV
jgi:hypothetical protein